MQTTGYIKIDKEKILLLVRSWKYGVALKIRKSGTDGQHLVDEEYYFDSDRDALNNLMVGKVVHV